MASVRVDVCLEVGQANALVCIRGSSQSGNYLHTHLRGSRSRQVLNSSITVPSLVFWP